MKKLFFFAAAALALASCSNDETVAQYKGEVISFRPLMGNVTRSSATSDITTSNISERGFYVTAFNAGTTANPYINDVQYTVNGSTYYVGGSTTATDNYYWPANNLDFYAYTYNDAATQVSKTDYHTFAVTPTAGANPTHVDLVYACLQNADKATYGETGVPLNFRHSGAKIALKVKNTAKKLKFDITGWKVGFLAPSGTFTFPTASGNSTTGNNTDNGLGSTLATSVWSGLGAASVATEYSSTFTTTYVAANTATASALSGEFILIPQSFTGASKYASSAADAKLNGTFIAVQLIIRNTDNATDGQGTVIAAGGTTVAPAAIWAVWPITGQWKPGYKYTYTLDLADGGYYEDNADTDEDLDPILENAIIKFVDVAVDAWDTDTNDDNTAGDETPVAPLP